MSKQNVGRPYSKGLGYFEFDLGLLQDPKFRRPRQKYGNLAQTVYIALLCILYRDKGYYIPYDGEQREDVLWQLGDMLHGGQYALKTETLARVIDELVACGLFSGDQYSRGIITSKRAQTQYYKATATRKCVDVDFEIWLLSKDDMEKLSSRSSILQNYILRMENGISDAENYISGPINSQSREEQSREEKSTEEKSIADNSRQRAEVLSAEAEKLTGKSLKIDSNFRKDIARLLGMGMQDGVFRHAVNQLKGKTLHNPAGFLRTILQGYEKDNIWTMEDIGTSPGETEGEYLQPGSRMEQWEQDWIDRVRTYQHEKEKERDDT